MQISISEQASYRWRKQYGGMGTDQLVRVVSDLTLDKLILAEAVKGHF